MYIETPVRSFAKAFSWRLLGTLATVGIVYALTGKISTSLAVGGLEAVSKMVFYFAHERLWNKLPLGRRSVRPVVVWFTGLSGSGKSTLADRVFQEMKRRGLPAERLDGDSIRDILPQTGFSRDDRIMHVRRVGLLASRLEANGVSVVASFISPYKESRDFVRGLCKNFVEVHVSTPLEICEKRDVKGLYAKARKGLIRNFTGVDDPYEAPSAPEVALNTAEVPADEAVKRIMNILTNVSFNGGSKLKT